MTQHCAITSVEILFERFASSSPYFELKNLLQGLQWLMDLISTFPQAISRLSVSNLWFEVATVHHAIEVHVDFLPLLQRIDLALVALPGLREVEVGTEFKRGSGVAMDASAEGCDLVGPHLPLLTTKGVLVLKGGLAAYETEDSDWY